MQYMRRSTLVVLAPFVLLIPLATYGQPKSDVKHKVGRRITDKDGKGNRRNYLVKYVPPKSLEDLDI